MNRQRLQTEIKHYPYTYPTFAEERGMTDKGALKGVQDDDDLKMNSQRTGRGQ